MKRLLLCFALAALAGCGPVAEPCTDTLFAMDTVMKLTVYGDEKVLGEAEELITDMERRLSVTDSGSEIGALNRTGIGEVSEDTCQLLERALSLCEATGGALDITVYPVVKAWGFTTGEYRVPGEQELPDLLELVNYREVKVEDRTVTLVPGMEIDLGSVAKGWAGDRVMELFREHGVKTALLNLGGNVHALGAKPDGSLWRWRSGTPWETAMPERWRYLTRPQ